MIPFLDLSALAAELDKDKSHGVLSQAIKLFQHASSTVADLEHVYELLGTLSEIQSDETALSKFADALTAYAVIMYCRATHSEADGRWKIGIEKAFDAEQKVMHKSVTDLRDTYVAHFGIPRGAYAARWIKEVVALEQDFITGDFSISFPTKRAGMLPDLLLSLNLLTNTALEVGEQLRKQRCDELAEKWRNATANFEFRSLALQFLTSSASFFGQPEDLADKVFRGSALYHVGPEM